MRRWSAPLDIRSTWETALRHASIADFRFHDLRHSATSYLAMNRASLAEIADIPGHKTLAMVQRYAHLSEQHTARIVAKMNAAVFGTALADEEVSYIPAYSRTLPALNRSAALAALEVAIC